MERLKNKVFYLQFKFSLKKPHFWNDVYKMTSKKCSEWNSIALFITAGFLGFCLNMSILTLALWQGITVKIAIVLGISTSTMFLFILNRHFVFSHARDKNIKFQFFGFITVCFFGGLINYFSATTLLETFPWLMAQVAEVAGLIIGAIFNFFLLRYFVFAK